MLAVNGIELFYEVHGAGPPVLAMGGWGTFCHGGLGPIPRSVLTENQLIVFDYRGLGSTLDPAIDPLTMAVLANDAAALLDHLGLADVDVLGILGMGGCIAQELAISRPDLVRSMFLQGCWGHVDRLFAEHLELLRDVFVTAGFELYQRLAASLSLRAAFYAENRHRLIGPEGAWKDLLGRPELVGRLADACLSHSALDRLTSIDVPTMVIHGGMDVLTPVRLTRAIAAAIPNSQSIEWPELAHLPTGRDERARFDGLVTDWLRR